MQTLSSSLFYVFLMSISIYGAQLASKVKLREIVEREKRYGLNLFHILVVVLLSFFVGFRNDVGVDWKGYVQDFYSISEIPDIFSSDQYYEKGYLIINWMVGRLGLGFQIMFFVVSVITWTFFFRSVQNFLLPLLMYFLFVDEYFFWGMNGVRQFAAMGIWVFSVRYIYERKLFYYLFYIGIASLFHATAWLMLVFYFLNFQFLFKRRIWLVIYGLSILVLVSGNLTPILDQIQLGLLLLGDGVESVSRYSRYVESGKFVGSEVGIGLGFIYKLLINGLILWYSSKLIAEFDYLRIHLFLFLVGAVIFNLFFEIQLINRLNSYFLIMRPILLSYLAYYLWSIEKKKLFSLGLMISYFLLFLFAISGNSNNCCPYKMIF
ncbi:capsular polysaccharide biosynthesis protein [Mariniradius saccharolyticus AK6]|uniref:Capsular polysaccharide biosynthesis protein n=1 Tax=Mariniradius saccharolyticus AK6 TaxID=1239962 RepID=M7XCX2_9BACT|nr:EpsG family protein [Mariniradius saccharolyticus]EMS32413.1 capsular polysaccharide biosynthesis protein [Mariniradius saccharolyticus AK6]